MRTSSWTDLALCTDLCQASLVEEHALLLVSFRTSVRVDAPMRAAEGGGAPPCGDGPRQRPRYEAMKWSCSPALIIWRTLGPSDHNHSWAQGHRTSAFHLRPRASARLRDRCTRLAAPLTSIIAVVASASVTFCLSHKMTLRPTTPSTRAARERRARRGAPHEGRSSAATPKATGESRKQRWASSLRGIEAKSPQR